MFEVGDEVLAFHDLWDNWSETHTSVIVPAETHGIVEAYDYVMRTFVVSFMNGINTDCYVDELVHKVILTDA